jgi:poly(3-hydroxybutyrate) depolymerase
MLYDAYQAYRDAVAPLQLVAAAASHQLLDTTCPPAATPALVRRAGAALDLISHAHLSHERPDFGIRSVFIGGAEIGVAEEILAARPFCNLLHFRKAAARDQPMVLVVAPLSGHFPTLVRGTVATLLPDYDVFLTDWANARDVPLLYGRFGFDDFVDVVIDFLHRLGPGAHVMAVCQPAVPVLAATALLAAAGDPCQPASAILMGGPIDTRINPTAVDRFATAHPLDWFERKVITAVPARYAGAFRRVYPGFLQLAGFLGMNIERHLEAQWALFADLVRGDRNSAAATRAFYDEYTTVMDLAADFYLETVKRVFHDQDLARGRLRVRGELVTPAAIERTALMTVEGERDDICGVGQTVAAHQLCTGIPPAKKTHHLQLKVGHYGVFHGRRWQTETYPKVKSFIRAQG